MTLRLSTGLRNKMLGGQSLVGCLSGGKLKLYSGSQPASAEAAPTGTLLATITDTSGAHTQEVLASGTVTLNSGAGGSVTALTVNGLSVLASAVPYNTSLTQTATDLAAAINSYPSVPKITASASGAVVTLKAPQGVGSAANGWVVATTISTMTKTDVNLASGVSSVNGLKWSATAAGAIDKLATQTWSGVGAADGTAGWFRFEGPVADSGALDSTESQIRMDGAISTSGAQLNMSSTSVASLATQTVTSLPVTFPAS